MVNNAPLIICVVLLIFVIAIFFILLWMNSVHPDDKKKEDPFRQLVKIENRSYSDKVVTLSNAKFKLAPGESKHLPLFSNEKIKTNDSSLILSNSALTKTVHITEHGLFSNLEGGKGSLNNNSENVVLFVEIGKDGRKWNKGFVYPGKHTEAFISKGSKWQVYSSDKRKLLGHLKTRGGLKIIFNGKNLFDK